MRLIENRFTRKQLFIGLAACSLLLIGGIGFGFWRQQTSEKPPEWPTPNDYSYGSYTASNGIELHGIWTDPDNIQLTAIDRNLNDSPYFGINGGFFYQKALLSIAVNDGVPVIGKKQDYGSGWSNEKYARGTFVWDRASRQFSVQKVSSVEELTLSDHERYWAQGGISMNLQDEANWHRLAEDEHMPGIDEWHMRTGLVYDIKNKVVLLVTNDLCTAENFRAAVREWGGEDYRDGIFLDGDGSSQFKSKEAQLPGDHREVRQILNVIR
ncbi:hypothetical protein [Gorillibacterium timonense]|uniref:hypothetical protein n=1 Tax=Gorillibacterium timonense TaxID=1689269 RepID=UPI00071CA216|nr:hypothetical protein [Gorillibacterium timonense]